MPNDKILREVNDRAFLAGLWKEAGVHTGRLAIGFFLMKKTIFLSRQIRERKERVRHLANGVNGSAFCMYFGWALVPRFEIL